MLADLRRVRHQQSEVLLEDSVELTSTELCAGRSTTNCRDGSRAVRARAEGDIHRHLVQIPRSLIADRHRHGRGRAWFRGARRDDDVVGRDGDIARRAKRGIGVEQQRQRGEPLTLGSRLRRSPALRSAAARSATHSTPSSFDVDVAVRNQICPRLTARLKIDHRTDRRRVRTRPGFRAFVRCNTATVQSGAAVAVRSDAASRTLVSQTASGSSPSSGSKLAYGHRRRRVDECPRIVPRSERASS